MTVHGLDFGIYAGMTRFLANMRIAGAASVGF